MLFTTFRKLLLKDCVPLWGLGGISYLYGTNENNNSSRRQKNLFLQ